MGRPCTGAWCASSSRSSRDAPSSPASSTLWRESNDRHGDSTSAREMLQLFAQAHAIRLDDRDRLARLLEGALD